MPLLTKLINVFFARRRKEIDFFMEHPQQVQQQLQTLIGGSVVIGVVGWDPVTPVAESKYVSMNFGR